MTRPNNTRTSEEFIAAIRETGSLPAAALKLDVSQSQIRYRLYRDNFNPVTLEQFESVVNGPAVSPAQERATIKRALDLGIWHVDENGDIQTYRLGDPLKGLQPNLLDEPRRVWA